MVSDENINLFASLFRGRSDVFARYWEKDGRSGYSPAYSFEWSEFMLHKNAGGSLATFQNKKLIPLDKEVLQKHLGGHLLAGVYPILSDGTSYFLAADFDGEHWFDDAKAYIQEAGKIGIATYLEKSKSGMGGHVWIFFDEAYPCYKSRRIGLELVRRAFHLSPFDKEVSFDRLFPNQDSVSKDGFGNLIALPLQGNFASNGTMVFIDQATGEMIPDQWEYLARCRKHNIQELEAGLSMLESTSSNDSRPSSIGKDELIISVRNRIEIGREFLTPSITQFLKDNLNFFNTEYLTRKHLGKSTYGVQKYFKLIDEVGDSIFLPRGFLKQLLGFLRTEGIRFDLEYQYPDF